jgi:hypothetical protein
VLDPLIDLASLCGHQQASPKPWFVHAM